MKKTIAQNPARSQFMGYVDRFLTAVDTIPRSTIGDVAIPPAIKEFRQSMKALTDAANKRNAESPPEDVTEAYFEHLEHAMCAFDCAVSEAVGVACLSDDPAPVFYDTVARSALDTHMLLNIAKSGRPAMAIEQVFMQRGSPLVFTAPRLADVQCELISQLSLIKLLLVTGANLLLELSKGLDGSLGLLLKTLVETGLKALETFDKSENHDVTPKKTPDSTPNGKTCFVTVLLPKLDQGGAVIDTLQLQFKVNGEDFTVSGAPAAVTGPIAMGLCGSGDKDVAVEFIAVNVDFPSDNEIGTKDRQVDKSPCPNRPGQGQLVMRSTVQDDNGVLKTITATVLVVKTCV